MSFHRALTLAAGAVLAAGLAFAAAPLRSEAATSFVVTTATDTTTANASCANPCSLRQAVTDANAATGAVTITFGVDGPFDLANGALDVSGAEALTVQGAADSTTTIHNSASDRLFLVSSATASLTLQDVALTGGQANPSTGDDGFGGAIDVHSSSSVTLIDTVISGSSATVGGGGIDANTGSTLTVIGSTISGNTAAAEGGGIDDNTTATLTIINSTIAGNTAGAPGGGAIAGITASRLTLVNDTITGNTTPATVGEGAVDTVGTGAATVSNTIISGNTGANCAGTITDGGNNLENGSSCAFATNAQHTDPLLSTLQANGGFAPTMALNPGSPAIGTASNTTCAAATNAGTPGAGGIDERGATRPQATACDIGAFEVVATTTALAAPTQSTAGDSVTLTATVTARQLIPGPASGTVSFFDGTTLLGTATLSSTAVAQLTTTALGAGNHSLSAAYTQTPLFLASASGVAAITVAVPTPATGAALPWAPALALVTVGLVLVTRSRRRR